MAKKAEPKPEPSPAEAEPVAPQASKVVTAVDRFRSEFFPGGSLKPLRWENPAGTVFRIVSRHGFLCYADGSQVSFDNVMEATAIANLLQPIRPNDNIQIHTS